MAATKTYANILKYGTQASYNALETKDASVLYFCTDTKKIYKGTIDFTDSVVFASSKPSTPIVGKLYILSGTGTAEVFDGSAWTVVSYPIVTTIADSVDGNDDVHVPSAKAVYDFVEAEIAEAIGGEGVVAKVEVSEVEGKIKVTDGKGTATDVAVHGVVTTPTYDSTTRKFTFPVVDGDDVEVELGRDIFIDPTANNRYENGNIYLYLNDGSGEEKAPTELVIPVTGLVKDYFGDDTDSITVTVDASTHKVTADVVLRADSESFTNALKLSSAEGDKGLYVDLSAVNAAVAAAQAAADAAQSAADAAQETADGAVDRLDDLEDDASNTKSIAAKIAAESTTLKNGPIKDAKDAADAAQATADDNADRLDVIEGTGEGSIAKAVSDESTVLKNGVIKDAQDTADNAVAAAGENAENLAALAVAVGWGTF